MKFLFIASGSKGNATLIYDDKTNILIDCGISKLRLSRELNNINKKISDIDFDLFTHEHIDHIKGTDIFSSIKKYSLKGTLKDLKEENILEAFKEYTFNTFLITPLITSHDAINPCGFLIKNNGERAIYMTDTGYIVDESLKYMNNAEYYIIEANHDILMLVKSYRSDSLKARILSNRGHLSNEDSARYISKLVGDKTKYIFLAHMSEECNTPYLILETYTKTFNELGVNFKNIKMIVLKQKESLSI